MMDQASFKTKRIFDTKTGRSYVVLDVPGNPPEAQVETFRLVRFYLVLKLTILMLARTQGILESRVYAHINYKLSHHQH